MKNSSFTRVFDFPNSVNTILNNFQEGEGNAYQLKLKEATWVPHLLRVSVTTQEYMSEKRQRITVRGVAPVDYAAESRFLLEEISKMKVSQ